MITILNAVIDILATLVILALLALVWLVVGHHIMPAPRDAQAVDAAQVGSGLRVRLAAAPVPHHRLRLVDSARLALALLLSAARPRPVLAEMPEPEVGESTEDDRAPVDEEPAPAAPEVARVPVAVAAALRLGADWPVPVDLTVPPVPQEPAVYQALSTSRFAALDVKGGEPSWAFDTWFHKTVNTSGSPS